MAGILSDLTTGLSRQIDFISPEITPTHGAGLAGSRSSDHGALPSVWGAIFDDDQVMKDAEAEDVFVEVGRLVGPGAPLFIVQARESIV